MRRRTGTAAAVAAALLVVAASAAQAQGVPAALRTAAEAGQPAAQFELANIYFQGQDIPRDYVAALSWYFRAAGGGNPGAAFAIGEMYAKGQGVRRDPVEAARWLQQSAQAGYSQAEVELAEMYAKGDGVARDPAQAADWYKKAAAQGDIEPGLNLNRLDAELVNPPRDRSGGTPRRWFSALMDSVFGSGGWRETGGYRTQAQEEALRAQGAETVAPGQISRHTLGTPDAPGAYDIVVAGMTMDEAATKLRRCGEQFHRIYAEAAHGTQGPHLHVEPVYAPDDAFTVAAGGRGEARRNGFQKIAYTRP